MPNLKLSLAAGCAAALIASPGMAQTTQTLAHQPPNGAGIGFLLTNGEVLYQGSSLSQWYKLTPDASGSYVKGSWSQVASLPAGLSPDAFASAVLADGRVVVVGGEYNAGNFVLTNACTIYDPKADRWTSFAPPAGWPYIGDSPSSVLPNGHLLIGRKLDKQMAELDPATLAWTALNSAGKDDFNAEEGWTLLPNGTVLTYDVKAAPRSEVYDPSRQRWLSAGSTVVDLASPPSVKSIGYGHGQVYHPPGEVGPGILRPDGTVFATGGVNKGGSVGHTAIYTPAAGGGVGSWHAGPNFAGGEDAADSFAALLPSGNVLVEAEGGALYEFDGHALRRTSVNGQGNSLLVLPTGEILVGGSFVYREAGHADPAWAPVIDAAPAVATRGQTYAISGRQLNGLSQAEAFGDEYQTNTNYPLVRITNKASGAVVYARTHGHSTMAVATGSAPVSTNFDVPANAATGASELVVVANGIASAPVAVTVR